MLWVERGTGFCVSLDCEHVSCRTTMTKGWTEGGRDRGPRFYQPVGGAAKGAALQRKGLVGGICQ